MDDNQYPTEGIASQGDKTRFITRIRILNRKRERIPQRLFCLCEADPMLPAIFGGLGRVKFHVHDSQYA